MAFLFSLSKMFLEFLLIDHKKKRGIISFLSDYCVKQGLDQLLIRTRLINLFSKKKHLGIDSNYEKSSFRP
jgi:hypothetical protein